MRRGALLALVGAISLSGCGLFGLSGARLDVSATGTYACPAFHGCIAWFAVRRMPWSPPSGWHPGKQDARFEANSDGLGKWTASGSPTGGPAGLEPGEYRLILAYSEVDDTKPLVLGTDDRSGTGLITTTIACDATITVTEATERVVVRGVFGPRCSIEADLTS